jgi:hypothetical protein
MKLLSLLLLSFFAFSSNAQVENKLVIPKSDYSLGAIAGTSQGLGLAMRYWPGKMGVQVAFLPIYTEYSQTISIGVSSLYKLREYKILDFYLNTGAHHLRTDYNTQTIFGIEPSFNLYTDEGLFSVFGSFGYNIALYQGGYSIYPGAATGIFFRL